MQIEIEIGRGVVTGIAILVSGWLVHGWWGYATGRRRDGGR